MKKFILALSVFVLLILSTSVFAQTQLDPNLYDENGFRIDQDFSEIFKDRETSLEGSTLPPRPEPSVTNNNVIQGELASCFDYYTFGSIDINLTQDKNTYSPGKPIVIRGQITNENRFPITNLTIKARLVKDIPNPEYLRSEIITLEDFNIVENISLEAYESFDVAYSHLLPKNSPQGEYQLFFYAYNNDRFNQSGLSFTNDVVGSRLTFDVQGNNPEHIYLDQTRITLNDKEHNVMAFVINHGKDESINIEIPLVNPSDDLEEMEVTYTLYKWDGLRKENIVDTKTETVTVPSEDEQLLTYTLENTDTSVYFLNIKADNQTLKKDKSVYDVQTESNIRFSVDGYDFPRINSLGVDQYPLKKDTEATLFTCFHNGAAKDTDNEVNIKTQVLDDKGNILSESEYQGKISGAINAIINKFTPNKDITSFKAITTMTDNDGNIIDKIEENYSCEDLDPTLCPIEETNYTLIWILFGLLVLIAIIIMIKKAKDKLDIPTVMFVLLILVFPLMSIPQIGEGAVVTDDFSIDSLGGTMYTFGEYDEDVNTHTTLKWYGKFSKIFNFVKDEVNQDTNIELVKGEFIYAEDNPTTGNWFIMGSLYDSPPMDGVFYGYRYVNESGELEYRVSDATDILAKFSVSVPIEKGNISIKSDDEGVVYCTNTLCEAKGAGTTNIRVKFNDTGLTSSYGNKKLVYEVIHDDWDWDAPSDVQRRLSGQSIIHDSGEFEEKIAPETCGNIQMIQPDNDLNANYCLGNSDSDLFTVVGTTQQYYGPDYLSPNIIDGNFPQLYLVKYNDDNNGFINFDNEGFGFVNVWESFMHIYYPQWVEETSHAFSFPDIVYTVTVSETEPTDSSISCGDINIDTDREGATINWNYDQGTYPQASYQVDITKEGVDHKSDSGTGTGTSVYFDLNGPGEISGTDADYVATITSTDTNNKEYTVSCPFTTKEDMCTNIKGIQTTVPEGKTRNADGTCSDVEGGSFSVSCVGTPATITDTGESKVVATTSGETGNVSYSWELEGSSVGTNSDTYTFSGSSGMTQKAYKIDITATDDTGSISNYCYVTVNNDLGGGGSGEITLDIDRPNIANCTGEITASVNEEVTCQLQRNGQNTGDSYTFDTTTTSASFSNLPAGEYRLACTFADPTIPNIYSNIEKCLPNPNFIED